MTTTLPPAAALATWTSAWLRGELPGDELGACLGASVHVLVDLPDTPTSTPLLLGLGRLRALGLSSVRAALPVPGDPVGLAGPPRFTRDAVEHGQAVVLAGTGLGAVPVEVGGAVEWRCQPAVEPPEPDPGGAATMLRLTLLESTRRLVDLDVASWQPEIPDALVDLRRRAATPLPASYDAARRETVERALLCLELVALADRAESGAISAHQLDQRSGLLRDLDRSARRALVATCR